MGSRVYQPLDFIASRLRFLKMPRNRCHSRLAEQLGSYEITSLLSKGRMGEVYCARDLRLKREVAIKVLPDAFARDAERVSRFQREAEVLASLEHVSYCTPINEVC